MISIMKNKYIIRSRELMGQNFISTLILKPLKLQKLLTLQRLRYGEHLSIFRILIAKECEKNSKMQGKIEVDESYFEAKRVRGRRVSKKHLCSCLACNNYKQNLLNSRNFYVSLRETNLGIILKSKSKADTKSC